MKQNEEFFPATVNGTYQLKPIVLLGRHHSLPRHLWRYVLTLEEGRDLADFHGAPLTAEEEGEEWA